MPLSCFAFCVLAVAEEFLEPWATFRMVKESIMDSVKEITIAWIAGRQIDFGSITMSFIDITDSSIRLEVNDRILQVIIPSSFQLDGCSSSATSSSGEVFLVTGAGCTSDEFFENMLLALNEKLERVAIQPDSLCHVLDHLLLAFQKYEKLQISMKCSADSMPWESRNSLADDNSLDHYGYDLAACDNEGNMAHFQYTTSGFLYTMSDHARLECETARKMVREKELISEVFEQSGSLAWCHVIPDPKLLTVYLLVHVGGIVQDDNLASALGISLNFPVKISLQFDKSLWVQRGKGLVKPLKGECKVTQEVPASGHDLAESSNEYTRTMSYGNAVLLPKLVCAFFQFLSNDTIMLEEKPRSRQFFDELHQFTSMENTFVGLLCFLCARLKTLQDWCIVCLNSLPYSVCRLRTCDKELCLFTFEEVGVGTPVLQEVLSSPEIIDFELSLALVAANSPRDVFEPFPTFLLQREQLRGRSGWFSKTQRFESADTAYMAAQMSIVQVGAVQQDTTFSSNKNLRVLNDVLSAIPPVEEMRKCRDEASLRDTLNSIWDKKMATDRQSKRPEEQENPNWANVKSLPFSVLRYVLSTSRVKLHLMQANERLPFFDSHYQFVVLHDSPEREAYFESRRVQKGGSFFAFHGSSADNWYSILRNGLRCLSNTSLMSAGASYGSGIYFGSFLEVSMRYCTQSGHGWSHGPLKEGFSVLAICEIIKGSLIGEQDISYEITGRGIMVVPPEHEKDVAIRYVIVLGEQYGRGQVLGEQYGRDRVYIDGTRMPDNIDIMKHYMSLRQPRQHDEEHNELSRGTDKDAGKQRDQSHAKASSQNLLMSVDKKPTSSIVASTSSMQAIAREYKNIMKQTKEAKERVVNTKAEDFPVLAGIEEVSIKLECTFPEDYPFSPPFIRVISPKFGFHTGHVTVGGSICMELLTTSGWSPAYTFESIIVQVVNAMVEGGGRLDKRAIASRSEYSELEAREAFNRVARDHGWNY
ncbi:hypothetical protein GOP47_0004902 [Adiantum capillus-veneris]|uniref:UBC core domain-containing protein n=1 Tax=Adiantum capillus-veneris TaxID=13818 RepID=A0A9D4V4B5_ADICA|nr:hypothetical protein GOP47_0004902 [Adiantum capillus-veneris]